MHIVFMITMMIISACTQRPKADFTKVKLNRWYSGMIDQKNIFLQFTSSDYNSASGMAFSDENMAEVELGKVRINAKSFEVNLKGLNFSHEGKWTIKSENLIFDNDNGKDKSVFKLQPAYSIPDYKVRYTKALFDTVLRREVTYGKAPGFYQSKPIPDINPATYPYIISEVLGEIKNNLFAE